ncbi:Uu.00g116780.m01.CDS01 [Anthostomella pinea]|uniref:Uu.00g116780.m01.CDS01 n=1 Tax=Anthostomella pinea TaxID=933095 RepID=A0AAI8VH57_9PEZI|nr:Uu.00g116780.m01.CDS01 [Anthostomella pinea]
MDPLSALAIAAAVVQFVDIGGRLLKKAWESHNGHAREKTEQQQLEEVEKQLSFLIDGVREASKTLSGSIVSNPTTPMQAQLLRLHAECVDISTEFNAAIQHMRALAQRPTRNRFSFRGHQSADKDVRDRDVRHILERLPVLRREVIDCVVLGLWDNSKETQQRELCLSRQMDAVIGMLAQLDESTKRAVQGFRAEEVDGDISGLRHELVETIWRKDWTSDAALTNTPEDDTPTRMNTDVVAHAISRDVGFETACLREAAIAQNFIGTYSWIFQAEPKWQNNKSAWDSFPKWLEDGSEPFYWITAKPGSGKSTLMKFVLQHKFLREGLSRWAGSLPFLVCKYYAWHPGQSLQKSIEGLKRTVLAQALLLFPELARIVTPRRWALFQVLRKDPVFPPWDTWELQESFDALLSQCGKPIKLLLA